MPSPFTGPHIPRITYNRNLFQPEDQPSDPSETTRPDPSTSPTDGDRLRYEDIAGPRRPLTPLPEYQPLPEHRTRGFVGRALGALTGLGVGMMDGGDPARAIGMAIRGGFQPDVAHHNLWERTTLPQAMEQRRLQLSERQAQDALVDDEIDRRAKVALINAREHPASITTTEMRGQQAREMEGLRLTAQKELEALRQDNRLALGKQNLAGRQMLLTGQNEFRSDLQDKIGGQQMARTQATIGAADRRFRLSEAGRNSRHAENLTAKSAAAEPSVPKASAANIAELMLRASPRLAERLKGLAPDAAAAEWNKYYGLK